MAASSAPPAPEPAEPAPAEEDPRRWRRLHALVLVALVVEIAVLWVVTRVLS